MDDEAATISRVLAETPKVELPDYVNWCVQVNVGLLIFTYLRSCLYSFHF